MLLSDSQLLGVGGNEILVKIISSEGQTYSTYLPESALVEDLKLNAIDFFYPNETSGGGGGVRFKLVTVSDGRTLHEFYTLQQEHVTEQDELLLLERSAGGAGGGGLWELGSLHAPAPAAVAAATARLPAPRRTAPHPDLQSLLSTNEMTKELRKILISLIEAGARLAAGGRHYEATLRRLCGALEESPPPPPPPPPPRATAAAPSPRDLAARLRPPPARPTRTPSTDAHDTFRRAECLQEFLDKFREWRSKMHNVPNSEAISTMKDIGFTEDEANTALQQTGCNEPAAALWLVGERGSSIFELINGLPDGVVLQALLKQAVVQRGLLNTRMLLAFIAMVGQKGSATLWLNAPHGGPLLQQILRTYHAEKYCLAVNQYSGQSIDPVRASSSRRN